ncbi:VOC family protein [Vagococcus acidifermentans]|uniref:VOC domain-containing protein n=1 Tax=Vagococcus acidifermentans TaxID=564710 RepID=A0A430B0G2_9ENTE|nr:VOC family protein [Vagococcus acidifermentans]RSU13830.1 hypothetical protein CBF27_02715 [Vagococcus acidifermentans]
MKQFLLSPSTQVASVALKVKNFEKMVDFYRDVIGLHLLNEENGMAIMGIKRTRRKLIGLIFSPDSSEEQTAHAGIYHTAILLPSRKDFSEFCAHLKERNYPIDELKKHVYSESVYVRDPEENVIEIIYNKPESEWENSEQTADQTVELDALISEAKASYSDIPENTQIGHVHLSVLNLEKSLAFYHDVLGFQVTDDSDASVKYLGTGNGGLHHQLAINNHMRIQAKPIADSDLGVDHITFDIGPFDNLLALKERLTELGIPHYFNNGKKIIGIDDPNGIQLWFIVFKKQQ